ncbi:hypothetical protein CN913_26335 [Bacillus cereus]|nr:hypothetical protein CN913_26335 [Bacillus cereus]PGP16744.1 hypothetical protein COA01_28740 [Bacillus cereus]PGW09895.1 hypothetical protein COD97_20090 [Bacillus cereus]
MNISIATPNISAVFEIYRRNSKYISDFRNISAQLQIYRRNFKYISDFRNISTYRQRLTIIATYTKRNIKPSSSN